MTQNATRIRLNGEPAQVSAGSVGEILQQMGIDSAGRRGIAVALNGSLVRRDQWDEMPVRTGDDLEIVGAIQGG